jgi:beta-galactosidase
LSRRQLDLSVTGGSRWDSGDQRHSLDLKKLAFENVRSLGNTYVNFDLKQMGVGCVDSWGALPRSEYMITGDAFEFKFVIIPTEN